MQALANPTQSLVALTGLAPAALPGPALGSTPSNVALEEEGLSITELTAPEVVADVAYGPQPVVPPS